MDLEHLPAPRDVGDADHDLAIETAGPPERRVQRVGQVGGADHDDLSAPFDAVHQRQQLRDDPLLDFADGLLALRGDRVDLVDEDDARRAFLCLLEDLAELGFALAVELVDDLRPAQRQERGVGLAGHRAREQGLAAAGRPVQQDALGCVDPEAGEDFRVAQRQLDHLSHAVEGAAESADVFVRQPAGGRLGARCFEPDQRIAAHDDHAARRRLDDAEFLEARSEGRDANPVAGDHRHVDEGPGDPLRRHGPQHLVRLRGPGRCVGPVRRR